jgi:hypothetical protein
MHHAQVVADLVRHNLCEKLQLLLRWRTSQTGARVWRLQNEKMGIFYILRVFTYICIIFVASHSGQPVYYMKMSYDTKFWCLTVKNRLPIQLQCRTTKIGMTLILSYDNCDFMGKWFWVVRRHGHRMPYNTSKCRVVSNVKKIMFCVITSLALF